MTATVSTIGPELPGGTGGVSVDRHGNVFVADFGAILSDRATMGRRIFRITEFHDDHDAHIEPGEHGRHDGPGRCDGDEGHDGPGLHGGPGKYDVQVFATGFEGASGNEFDSKGFLYQSNIRGNYISRIAPDGSHEVFARDGIVAPVGIAIDEEDTLYVANCGDQSIMRISPEGRSDLFVRDERLVCPNGVALDGALFVVARSDHRIYRVSLDGGAAPFAGSGERGRVDGPAAEARFSLPNDIAPGPDGRTLYVNEIASTTNDPNDLSPMVVRRIHLDC